MIETEDVTCIIKGSVSHPQYNKLRKQMSFKIEDSMQFECTAASLQDVQVYDVLIEDLVPYTSQKMLPLFFENGRYEVVILPKTNEGISFYHEFPEFRDGVSKVSRSNILTGTLHFRNEVGLTSFEIRGEGNRVLLTVILEVYPTKLDYKNDYKKLLDEVNEEIYNLAYHFIKRTYLYGSAKIYKEPSLSEFYRLFDHHFEQYKRSINQIERFSHQNLIKNYIEVRGSQLRRPDLESLNYLRRNASKFEEVPNGITIEGRTVMPSKGIMQRKEHTADTYENRYVKWTMSRISARLKELKRVLEAAYFKGYGKLDTELLCKIDGMIEWIDKKQKNTFWKQIGVLDRSVTSLVLQMAAGYRTVLQVYTTISKSIVLQGQIYKMSIKDIATLYEYWTFLKLGRLLDEKCTPISQDIVKVNTDGLFVNLDKSRTAERKYIHPVTNEEITLKYQFDTNSNRVPTVQQKPDSMLSIGKKGKTYQYQYIFDAKYRLDLETYTDMPGPMQDDINTMHRYRDSIVVHTGDRYERTAFGAYVLFPWFDEQKYESHPLYRSIETVNIGAFPFLPNTTSLVSRFIDNLLNKGPEQLQSEGILPKGFYEEETSSYSVDYVLICTVVNENDYVTLLQSNEYKIASDDLPDGWQRIRNIAIYDQSSMKIRHYAEVMNIEVIGNRVNFMLSNWKAKLIEARGFCVPHNTRVNRNNFFRANSIANLHSKTEEEDKLWRMLNRISNDVEVILDSENISSATKIISFKFDKYELKLNHLERQLEFVGEDLVETFNMDLAIENETYIFQRIVELIYRN
ncbi:restriction endonuclease-like protein [Sporosarcina aquimarina]|uniref:Restriction endonuclease-like protein n=1 Tax=Sporosarcina aquimarina TaxID=114975 RepID=A0ABU4G2E1_9BACL|nr:restriction endonuclease-like protein [Sporosarcina aquimarina]MDW0111141.1 restriction endonuclease-like protein [Sporosarcina aquimarina]